MGSPISGPLPSPTTKLQVQCVLRVLDRARYRLLIVAGGWRIDPGAERKPGQRLIFGAVWAIVRTRRRRTRTIVARMPLGRAMSLFTTIPPTLSLSRSLAVSRIFSTADIWYFSARIEIRRQKVVRFRSSADSFWMADRRAITSPSFACTRSSFNCVTPGTASLRGRVIASSVPWKSVGIR